MKNIDIYDDRDPSDKKVYSKWVKESTSLVLKDGNPYLSVEMMANYNPSPISVAGNILIHAIGDVAVIKFKDSRNNEKYILDNKKSPRYLLIVIPEPPEESDKKDQMMLMEHLIKKLQFLENSSLTNFKICFMSNYKEALKELLS